MAVDSFQSYRYRPSERWWYIYWHYDHQSIQPEQLLQMEGMWSTSHIIIEGQDNCTIYSDMLWGVVFSVSHFDCKSFGPSLFCVTVQLIYQYFRGWLMAFHNIRHLMISAWAAMRANQTTERTWQLYLEPSMVSKLLYFLVLFVWWC